MSKSLTLTVTGEDDKVVQQVAITGSDSILAATLRSLADELDPPRKAMRQDGLHPGLIRGGTATGTNDGKTRGMPNVRPDPAKNPWGAAIHDVATAVFPPKT